MESFFKLLFFAKTILLTPAAVDIQCEMVFTPNEPISAITLGATLQIEVSAMIRWTSGESIAEFRDDLNTRFPPGSIHASLIGADDETVMLEFSGGHSFTENSTRLILSAIDGVPTGTDFESVIVTSQIQLDGISVYWQNYRK